MDDMRDMIFGSMDVDCDGISYAYRRVSVPSFLAGAYHEIRDKFDYWREQEDAHRSTEVILAAIENDTIDTLHIEIDRAVKHQERYAGMLRGLEYALEQYRLDADISLGMGDWFPLNMDDAHRLEDDLQLAGGFDWDYWQEEGYYSTGVGGS